jgi:ribA/ribD-fused uncharacterized protein
MYEIKGFFGRNFFLSNFFGSPLIYDGILYPTVEHAYQAAKTHDVNKRLEIAGAHTPDIAKKMGRILELREDWESVKFEIMYYLVKLKFENCKILKDALLETKDAYLEETNHWGDKIWGVCSKTGEGENNLGKILMNVRNELLTQSHFHWLCNFSEDEFIFTINQDGRLYIKVYKSDDGKWEAGIFDKAHTHGIYDENAYGLDCIFEGNIKYDSKEEAQQSILSKTKIYFSNMLNNI